MTGLRQLVHELLSARCQEVESPSGDTKPWASPHNLRFLNPSHPRAFIASYNEHNSSAWEDFQVGAGFGAVVLGATAAWAGSPIMPSVLGGAFGGGTMGYSYFQLTRFLEDKHQRSDAVTHAFAGSVSGYLYASILYGPRSIKLGAVSGGMVGLLIYAGAESLREWRYEAGLKRRIARADHVLPAGVAELDKALDGGHITPNEHAEARAFLILNDRSKEDAEKKLAALWAGKRQAAQSAAGLWPRWLPLQKMTDEEVLERERRQRLYEQAHLRMQEAAPDNK